MNILTAIVKNLEKIGVDHVFGGSGQVNAPMLLSLKDSDKIKTIIVKNEQAASFMACGYSMFSDKLGVCFATGGPGAFNLFSGLAVAYSDSLPVLAITGYTSKDNRGKGALNESSGLSRTPDSQAMFSATTKKSFIIENANDTLDVLEEAINLAYEGRPGPVHIHIPKNLTVQDISEYRDINVNISPVVAKKKACDEFADRIVSAVNNHEKIGILVGYGAIRSGAREEILELIDKYQIPFMSTMDAKGYISEGHELSLGVYGTTGDESAKQYFEECDVVIALGNSFAQNATFSFKEDLYENKVLMHINIDKHEINKVYNADYALVSDIKPALQEVLKSMKSKNTNISKTVIQKNKWYNTPTKYKGEKIHPGDLVKAMSDNLPENAIVIGDAGSHMLWLSAYLNLEKNNIYQNPGSFGPMASHTNGAIGIKCANPDKVVISGSGDGCYLMAGFELMTAVENNIPLVWVIFNNGEFNVIKKFLINMFGKHAYMQFMNPNYVEYAKSCGAEGFRVEKLEDFADVFNKAIKMNKPVLIDVQIESEVYPPFSLAKV